MFCPVDVLLVVCAQFVILLYLSESHHDHSRNSNCVIYREKWPASGKRAATPKWVKFDKAEQALHGIFWMPVKEFFM